MSEGIALAHSNEREIATAMEVLQNESIRLTKLADDHRWISVVERVPEMKTPLGQGTVSDMVLAIVDDCSNAKPRVALAVLKQRKSKSGVTATSDWCLIESEPFCTAVVTHWMPIPSLPMRVPAHRKKEKDHLAKAAAPGRPSNAASIKPGKKTAGKKSTKSAPKRAKK